MRFWKPPLYQLELLTRNLVGGGGIEPRARRNRVTAGRGTIPPYVTNPIVMQKMMRRVRSPSGCP